MHRSLNTYNELQVNLCLRIYYAFVRNNTNMTLKSRCSQLIREQMVKSLEIIKDLEEQVKLVPVLKVTSIINSIITINTFLLRVNTKISRS